MRDGVEQLEIVRQALIVLPRQPVNSSQIAEIGYLYDRQMLVVKFKHNEALYAYANVPEDFWNQMKNAQSVGQFFSQRIKIHPDLFPFIKLF